MKITIYELLGMIKDGKELPKLEKDIEKDFAYYVYDKWGDTCNLKDLKNILNDEVEILEEKKIPEKLNFNHKEFEDDVVKLEYKNQTLNIGNVLLKMSDRIDEIIDYLDYLKSKGDE